MGDRALFPSVESERLAGAEAADLFTLQLSRDATVKSDKANFSVQDKGTDVDVAGAQQCNLVIKCDMLGMQEAALVEVHLDTGQEEFGIIGSLRELHQNLIREIRNHQVDFDST